MKSTIFCFPHSRTTTRYPMEFCVCVCVYVCVLSFIINADNPIRQAWICFILFSFFKPLFHFQLLTINWQAWLSLMHQATEETDASQITLNLEAQHRYLTWRTQKVCPVFFITFLKHLQWILFGGGKMVGWGTRSKWVKSIYWAGWVLSTYFMYETVNI